MALLCKLKNNCFDKTSCFDKNLPSPNFYILYSQVLRVAEKCAAALATVLPPDHIIRLVSSIMYTEPYPQNMGAVKMLHRVVEHWGKDVIEPHLDNVMPRLIEVNF